MTDQASSSDQKTSGLTPTKPLSDPILEFARKETEQWNNRGFTKQPSIRLGAGKFYTVSFVGQDGENRENYVYVRDGQGPELYTDFRALAIDKAGGRLPYWEVTWLKTAAMFVVVVLLLAASVITAIWPGDGKAFTAFMSAFTAALGYLAGKGIASDADVARHPKVIQ